MRLKTIYVRFYRAFNFDYIRKADRRSDSQTDPNPWDMMDDGNFYPYIAVNVDHELTCVVGANESGKSQLLSAVEFAMGIKQPAVGDFCRYSAYFTVADAPKRPHFGLQFVDLTEREIDQLSRIVRLDESVRPSSFHIFRTELERFTVYLDGETPYPIDDTEDIRQLFPQVSRIDPDRALPDSVPLSFLVHGGAASGSHPGTSRVGWRKRFSPILDNIPGLAELLNKNDNDAFLQKVRPLIMDVEPPHSLSDREQEARINELNLAFDLLVTVGEIHSGFFDELQTALDNEDEGLVNGIVREMNKQLDRQMNLARWWTQDKAFSLAIEVREFDLVFTIRDRTGSNYSFGERSDGLKYFLSYLIQFLTHLKQRRDFELLLMDEPDAYLSNQGQQDLLRLLQEFTLPTDDTTGGQVLFVTHSPFLIDKNRADRIRVLDKGTGKEGARVVHDIARNHFEPLRTALGGFVGETVFIGNCNLIIEGITDQIYLAGMSTILHRQEYSTNEHLNLNDITLVPAGSASHVPYMTFLARGRDADKPAVVVLLDGDGEGDREVKVLRRGGPRYKQLLRPEYIVQLKPGIEGVTSDRVGGPLTIEDLIPVPIALAAVTSYVEDMDLQSVDEAALRIRVDQALQDGTSIFDAVQVAIVELGLDLHLEKLAFARHALSACSCDASDAGVEMRRRFASLFAHLTPIMRQADRERAGASISQRIERAKDRFVRDHERRFPTRADLVALLERIVEEIDDDIEGNAILGEIRIMNADYDLTQDLNAVIEDRDELIARLETLQYVEVASSQSDEGN